MVVQCHFHPLTREMMVAPFFLNTAVVRELVCVSQLGRCKCIDVHFHSGVLFCVWLAMNSTAAPSPEKAAILSAVCTFLCLVRVLRARALCDRDFVTFMFDSSKNRNARS